MKRSILSVIFFRDQGLYNNMHMLKIVEVIFSSCEVNLWTERPRTCLGWIHFAKSGSLSPGSTTEPIVKRPPYAFIIGVSFGGLFVLALCIVFLVRFCKNRKTAYRGKRGSDNMPPEEAFPGSQKYELKSVAVNNAYVAVGEVNFGCDKQRTGFSNEGFQWYYCGFSRCKRRICVSFFFFFIVNLQPLVSEILISQSQLVDCGNMIRDQSLDCKNLRKPNATLRKWYRKKSIFCFIISC